MINGSFDTIRLFIYSCKTVRSSIQIFSIEPLFLIAGLAFEFCLVLLLMFSRWLHIIQLFMWLPIQ